MNKHIRLILGLFGFLIVLLGVSACPSINSQNNIANLSEVNKPQLNVQEFQASVGKRENSWNAVEIRINKNGEIRKVSFYDETLGYAITPTGILYKTSNSGKSWEKISSITNLTARDIFFITPTEGFVVANKLAPSVVETAKYESHIMKTEDGGRSWKTVYFSNSTVLEKLAFNSAGEGVTGGVRVSLTPELNQSNFVLLTNDRGQTWIDDSEKLNEVAPKIKGKVRDTLTDIIFTENKEFSALSVRGKIYNTVDVGKSWRLISQLIYEPEQTCICNLGRLDNGGFWVAGGTISIEGKWGMIAVTDKGENWKRYRLNGYYFADVEFLSSSEVIAAGSIVAEKNFGGANELNKGVVLYSSDSGNSWSIVHESKSSSEFISIAKLSERKLFIAGKNGVGVLIERN